MALLCWHMAVAGLYNGRENKQRFGIASLSAIPFCVKTRYARMTSLTIGSVDGIRGVPGFCENEYYKQRLVRHFTIIKRISRGSWTDRSRAPPET